MRRVEMNSDLLSDLLEVEHGVTAGGLISLVEVASITRIQLRKHRSPTPRTLVGSGVRPDLELRTKVMAFDRSVDLLEARTISPVPVLAPRPIPERND